MRRDIPSPGLSLNAAKQACKDLYRISDDRYALRITGVNEAFGRFTVHGQLDVGLRELWHLAECVFEADRTPSQILVASMN